MQDVRGAEYLARKGVIGYDCVLKVIHRTLQGRPGFTARFSRGRGRMSHGLP